MRRLLGIAAVTAVLTVSACGSGSGSAVDPTPTRSHAHHPSPTRPPSPTHRPAPTTSAPKTHRAPTPSRTRPAPSTSAAPSRPSGGTARQILDSMSEAQRVGQLLMVDCPSTGVAATTVTAIRSYHVGSVILDGDSTLSVAQTRAVTGRLQSDAPARTRLFVSTDQEGGLVRRMRGPGFSDIPSALQQGRYPTSALRADAREWGGQLTRAGINVDLAPVLDTVPNGFGSNPPIGDLDREYGHTPSAPAMQGVAFADGLADAGVLATAKHFPGLGRVHSNTDTDSGVTDSVTTRHDPYLTPFGAAVQEADIPFVMMSTAIYSRIDPGTPAAFSPTIVTGMLRGDLGFTGVIISDDLGAARQVSGYSVGNRAIDFVAAGGDIVLTVDASQAHAMTAALLARARSDPAFRHKVGAAALTVLKAKQARGLLG